MNKRKSKSIKDLVDEMTAKKNKKKSKEKGENETEVEGNEKKAHNPEAYLSKEQYQFL